MNKTIKKCILCLLSFQMFFIGIDSNCYANIAPKGDDETPGCPTLDPIDTKTGNSHFTEKDLLMKDSLFELMFARRYNSNNNDFNTPLGVGWTHSYDWRLVQIESHEYEIDSSSYTNSAGDVLPIAVKIGNSEPYTLGSSTQVSLESRSGGIPLKKGAFSPIDSPLSSFFSSPYFGTIITAPSTIEISDQDGNDIDWGNQDHFYVMPVKDYSLYPSLHYEVYMGNGVIHEFHKSDDVLTGVYQSDNSSMTLSLDSGIVGVDAVYVLKMPGGEKRYFNTYGMMTRIENEWGEDNKNNITLSYSDDRLLEKVESSGGASLDFTYDDYDRLVRVQATPDLYVTFEYSGDYLESTTRHIDGVTNGYTYDYTVGKQLLTEKISSIGVTNNFSYLQSQDKYQNYRADSVDIDGFYYKTDMEYDEDTTYVSYTLRGTNQCYIYHISPKSHKTQYIYGPAETFEEAEVRGKINYNTTPPFDTTQMTYFDNEVGDKYMVYLEYNDSHEVTKFSKSYNDGPTKKSYNMTWNQTYKLPSSQTAVDGSTTTVTYEKGSPKVTSLNGRSTTYNYDSYGRLISVKDANNNTTYYNRGEDGWIDKIISPVGPTLNTTVNSYGYQTVLDIIPEGQTNSIGRTYTMDRGSHGRINSVTYPDGLQDFNNFNSWGYLTNRIDRAGRNYDFTYAYPTDMLKSHTQYLEEDGNMVSVTTKYDYDEQFNTLDITEPRRRYVETYLFDIQNRIIGVTNIEGQAMSVDYGLQDMVKEIKRFDDSEITVGYDQYARQNIVTITTDTSTNATYIAHNMDDTIACVSNLNSSVEYTYRLCNKLTNVVSYAIVQTESSYKHDNVGNTTNTTLNVCELAQQSSDIYSTTNTYYYDAGNRLTNMVLTAWERQAPAWQNIQNISYVYNPTNGLASSWTNSASGIFCSYEYDIMDRPVSLEWKASDGSIIKSYDYMYSNADMITNVVDNAGNVVKYEFDTLDRLTKEINGDTITSYKYDLAGNRLQMRKFENAQVTNEVDYTLGLGNRLAIWGDNGEAHYNLAGCLTNMVSNTDGRELNLSWDERYQLSSVNVGVGTNVFYDYNVLGQRVSRKEISGTTTNIEYYVHDGGASSASPATAVIADLDEDKELLRSYTYAPGYDNIISMTTYGNETNTYFYVRNHNNSIVSLVDEEGDVAESYTYTAYGEVTVFDTNGNELSESALGNRFTFQGREIDWSTGLYNFRARWYDAETGRWLSKDPIGINGGLNQYVFCGNNPVMFGDPEGTDKRGQWPDNLLGVGAINNTTTNQFSGAASAGRHGDLTACSINPGKNGGLWADGLNDIDFIYPTPEQPINSQTNGAFKIGANGAKLKKDKNGNFILIDFKDYWDAEAAKDLPKCGEDKK